MLRASLLVLAVALMLLGAILLLGGHVHAGANSLGGGLVLLIGTAFERWRYRPNATPGAQWQPTSERFEDPQTGKAVQVYYDPRSGERRYVSDSDPPPPGAGASHPR